MTAVFLRKISLAGFAGALMLGAVAAGSPAWALTDYKMQVLGYESDGQTAYTGLTLKWINQDTGAEISGLTWSTVPDAALNYASSQVDPTYLQSENAVLQITMPSCNGSADVYYYNSVEFGVDSAALVTDRALAEVFTPTSEAQSYALAPSRKPCKPNTPSYVTTTNMQLSLTLNDMPSNGGHVINSSTVQMLNTAEGYASWQKIVPGIGAGQQGAVSWGTGIIGNGTARPLWARLCYRWVKASSPSTCITYNSANGITGRSTIYNGDYGFRVVPKNAIGTGTPSNSFVYTNTGGVNKP